MRNLVNFHARSQTSMIVDKSRSTNAEKFAVDILISKKLSMLRVHLSSYRWTQEAERAREKRLSGTRQINCSSTSQLHP